jgi:hypothetical protein
MHRVDPQLPEDNRFPVTQTHVDERSGARLMHHDGHIEAAGEFARSGEVVRVRVRIDHRMDAQTVARSKRQVPIDLAQLWIDQHGGATLGATDEIRPATT